MSRYDSFCRTAPLRNTLRQSYSNRVATSLTRLKTHNNVRFGEYLSGRCSMCEGTYRRRQGIETTLYGLRNHSATVENKSATMRDRCVYDYESISHGKHFKAQKAVDQFTGDRAAQWFS